MDGVEREKKGREKEKLAGRGEKREKRRVSGKKREEREENVGGRGRA